MEGIRNTNYKDLVWIILSSVDFCSMSEIEFSSRACCVKRENSWTKRKNHFS